MTDLVIQNFGRGSWKCAETVVAQHREIIRQRHAREFDAVGDLHWRERVNVNLRDCILHRSQDVAVVELGQIARKAALDADFSRAQLPSLLCFARHVVKSVEVCVGFSRAPAEGAKLASYKTDIGEINVSVHHVADDVTHELDAKEIGRDEQTEKIIPATVRERVAVVQ